jgi:hypothetical protein
MLHACCLSRAPGSGFRAVCRPPLADGKHRCGDEGDEDTKAHQDISGASAHVRPYADETAMAWSRSESLAARCAPGNGPIRPVTHHRHNNLRKPTRTSAYPAAVSQPHSPALAPAVSHSHSHSRSPSLETRPEATCCAVRERRAQTRSCYRPIILSHQKVITSLSFYSHPPHCFHIKKLYHFFVYTSAYIHIKKIDLF